MRFIDKLFGNRYLNKLRKREFTTYQTALLLAMTKSEVCELICRKELKYKYYHGNFRVSGAQIEKYLGFIPEIAILNLPKGDNR